MHCAVLQPRVVLGGEIAPFCRRVLALVGSAFVGGRILRSLHYGGDRVPVRAAGRRQRRTSGAGFLAVGRRVSFRRHHRHAAPPLLCRDADSGVGVRGGFQRWDNIKHTRARNWLRQYKWVVYFFVAVAFWNLVGAGIFGFMINPPIALYYMQGLNTTAVHAHGALYGVYGTLGLALTLFSLRAMNPEAIWKEGPIKFAFWAINVGLLMEIALSLLPIGLLQTYRSVAVGYWSARSPEFMQTGVMQSLRWMRIIGDMVFATGAVAFVYFALDLILRKPRLREAVVTT